jgi:hypothetical protein
MDWHTKKDKKPIRRRVYTPPTPAKECDIVGKDGSSVHFFSVKSAKRALAGLVSMLKPRKNKEEPKQFTIKK